MNLTILILNILGTFLVSIEAIKIENLKKLILYLRNSNSHLNPKINCVDESTHQTLKEKLGCYIFIGVILLIFGPISYIILSIIFPIIKTYWLIPLSILGAFLLWTFLIYFIELIVKFLSVIEKYTSKGIIGISGFLILVISFILQYNSTLQ